MRRSSGSMKSVAVCGLALWCAVAVVSRAQDVQVIKTGTTGKVTINLAGLACTGGGGAAVFRDTLRDDLGRSGWFRASIGGAAAINLNGFCQDAGGRLAVRADLRNVATGQAYLSGRTFDGPSADARRLAHALADEIVWAVKRVPGIASTRIVMVGSSGARKDLYMCDSDGHNMVRLTNKGAVCIAPDWGPRGDRIIFTSFQGGYPDVYEIVLSQRVQRRLVNFPGLNSGAAISPDGNRIALTLSKDGNPELYVMDRDGRRPTRLTRTQHAAEASPSWSPDGRRIVYVSDRSGSPQLYLTDRDGRELGRLTFRGTENVAPDWGPDGRIAYSSRRQGRYQICVINPDKREETQITNEPVDYEDPSWAPDSRHIVCSRTVAYHSDLYILDTLGDTPLRLTTVSGDWYSPAWSPRLTR